MNDQDGGVQIPGVVYVVVILATIGFVTILGGGTALFAFQP